VEVRGLWWRYLTEDSCGLLDIPALPPRSIPPRGIPLEDPPRVDIT
jgi:hypothetical protein